mgnify:CR=1 FL=1
MLLGSVIGQPDSLKTLAQEAMDLNNQMKRVFPVSSGLSIQFKKGLNHITITNDSLGNIMSAWFNNCDLYFENDSISHASYALSKTKDYQFYSIDGFGIELLSRDTVLVTVTKDDCFTFVDSIKWELKTYPIRVSQGVKLVALIYKGSFEVLGQNNFTKKNYEKILAVLKKERYLDSEDSIYLD